MSQQTLETAQSAQSLEQEEAASAEDYGDNIRVFVRIRPPSEKEQASHTPSAVSFDTSTNSVLLRTDQPRTFTFDGVLGDDATQDEVFELVGRSIGASCLAGYNGSVYVYGQTSAGKTHTMVGPVASVQSMQFDERRGLICRILDFVFSEIHRRRAQTDSVSYLCRCSFLEIYKEQITDLLEPGLTNLQIREDVHRGMYVERLTEQTAWSVAEAFQTLSKGIQQRHVGATHMNERSSRSHAVFTLAIEVASTRAGVTSTRVAKLSLVDLAGSERQQVVDATGSTAPFQPLRVKEAAAINKSLSALTNVITSLSRAATSRRKSGAVSDDRRPYVHYRDSRLTWMLRDSLGGNSKTAIVANISPSHLCGQETLSTLKFASRAKHIRCAAVKNEEFSGTVESLMNEVKVLRQQLAQLSSFNASQSKLTRADSSVIFGKDGDEPAEDETEVLYSRKRVRRLEVLLAAALERERVADQRQHQLQRLAEFLEDLEFRKGQYRCRLLNDFKSISEKMSQATQGEDETPELTEKFIAFADQLANMIAGSKRALQSADSVSSLSATKLLESQAAADGEPAASERGANTRAPARKRGTSQSLQRGAAASLAASPRDAESGTLSSGIHTASFPGAVLVDEALFLRDENQRLRHQLQFHPEMFRLALENRALRDKLASSDSQAKVWKLPTRKVADKHLQRDRSLTRTSRSQALLTTLVVPSQEDASTRDQQTSEHSEPSSDGAVEDVPPEVTVTENQSATWETAPPVTSEMMLHLTETDEENSVRTWVYCEKVSKEVYELFRAKERLAAMVKDIRNGDRAGLGSRRFGLGGSGQRATVGLVEPRVMEELAHATEETLSFAQSIVSSQALDSAIDIDAVVHGNVDSKIRSQGRIGRQIGRSLEAVNEQEINSMFVAVSPRDSTEQAQMRQSLHRVKALHSTLDQVNNALSEAHDQWQRLREEYESRRDECQFFELQCSRLNIRCNDLAERLESDGPTNSVVSSSSSSQLPAQARRCVSLSCLRDQNFWDQRFQELSRLTGATADRLLRDHTAPCLHMTSVRLQPGALRPSEAALRASAPTLQHPAPTQMVVRPEFSVAGARAAPVVTEARPALSSVRPPSSSSLSSLHADDRQVSTQRGSAWATVRRVASAPLLPSTDLRGPLVQTLLQESDKGAGEASAFDLATILSLSRQPGDKSAALQYVRQATTSALTNAVARPEQASRPVVHTLASAPAAAGEWDARGSKLAGRDPPSALSPSPRGGRSGASPASRPITSARPGVRSASSGMPRPGVTLASARARAAQPQPRSGA